ncbi:hypothetical protein ACFL3P_05510 [Pseudomonadota bacterium]
MKWLTFKIQREPGFRFNLTDLGLIVLLCAVSSLLFYQIPDRSLFWIPLYLGLSFFLFCNVFRIGNRLEPFWYVPFTIITGISLYTFNLPLFWWLVLLFLEPLKWGLIIYHIKRRRYSGVFYRKLESVPIDQDHANL